MAWAKVDDQWFAHRKVVGLSLAARGLWTTVLSWTCAQRSPQVPTHMVAFLAAGADVEPLTAELVDAGLWRETDGGWEIHDWAEYQERSTSEKRADAGRKGGQASGKARSTKQTASKPDAPDEAKGKQTEATPDGGGEANDEAGTPPVPPRPGPSHPEEEERATRHPTWTALAERCPAKQWGEVGTFGAKARLLDTLTAVEDAGWPPDRAADALLSGDLSTARSVGAVLLSRAETLAATEPPPLVEVVDCSHCRGSGLWWSDDGREAIPCQHPEAA